MSLIPNKTIDALRGFSDLAVNIYGINCTLYIPNNLTDLESKDMYSTIEDLTYDQYDEQKVVIDWATKDFDRLVKLGIFKEGDLPITARFRNVPEVVIHSYIKVPLQYIPGSYKTDEFEIINTIISNTYNAEVLRRYSLAPRRQKLV